jgi:hypothetical protein
VLPNIVVPPEEFVVFRPPLVVVARQERVVAVQPLVTLLLQNAARMGLTAIAEHFVARLVAVSHLRTEVV